jgi:FixJ family two-component response regulator
MREPSLRRIKEMDFNPSSDLPSVAGTICLVDDDPSMLKALDRLLSSVGLQVQLFHEPLGFLSYASCHCVALAVLDIWMPGMSGLATQQKLQTVSPNTGVIIITANDDYSVRNEAIQRGAFAFFVKPFDNETFLTAVHQAMASKT